MSTHHKHPREVSTESARKFGARLMLARSALGMSVADIVRETGIDRGTIEKLEKGETKQPFLSTASAVTLVVMERGRPHGIELMHEIFDAATPGRVKDADFNCDGKEDEDDVPYCGLELSRVITNLNLAWLKFWANNVISDQEIMEMRTHHDRMIELAQTHKYLAEKVHANSVRDRTSRRRR